MTDWSKAAAEKMRVGREAKHVQDSKIVQDRETVSRQAANLWNALSTLFGLKAKEFNEEPGMMNSLNFVRSGATKFTLSGNSTGKSLTGDFDQTNSQFHFRGDARSPYSFTLKVRVLAGQSDSQIVAENEVPIDLESFCNDHIESILGIL
jgi:hypothetical protein